MAGIKEIEIEGFKAFPNKFSLELDKNLLMYGENGSGKSSIYYALHALLQSVYKSDHGAKYFRHEDSEENLINIYKLDDVKNNGFKPHIKITLDNEHQWELSRDGLSSTPDTADDSELRLLNKTSAFINYSYISRFRYARNSEMINLWNVFIKDILPFYVPVGADKTLADIFNSIIESDAPKGRKNIQSYRNNIDNANVQLSKFINKINIIVSDLYNQFFKEEGEDNLLIQLRYLADDDRENDYHEPYLFAYEKFDGKKYSLRHPNIGLYIKTGDKKINKPQSFFNEARLTAIALAIRFACLQNGNLQEGQFLALDDMLISLDMSNRMKVIDYLLSECNQYKIYLFTHDRAFYNFIWTKISKKKCNNQWLHKRIYMHHSAPMLIDEDDDCISKAKRFYEIQDYESSAIYLRKSLEETIGNLLPYELKTRADGSFATLEALWQKLIKYYSDNGKSIDKNTQKVFDDSKLLILNPAAHFQRLSNPIYKKELEMTFDLHTQLSHIDRIENMLCIEKGKIFNFTHPTKPYKCDFSIDRNFILEQGDRLISVMPKCKDIQWNYNGIMYYDFEKGGENQNHPLKTATPRLNKFIERLEKLPLEITEEIFWANCKVDNTPLKDFFGGVNIISLMLASTKNRNTKH
jgi:hypothetical protein